MKQINIDVALDGTFTIDVTGAEGKECTELTAELESALGVVTKVEKKPEYHRQARVARGKGAGR